MSVCVYYWLLEVLIFIDFTSCFHHFNALFILKISVDLWILMYDIVVLGVTVIIYEVLLSLVHWSSSYENFPSKFLI